jgi:CheY-specific phosphatase CheX
MSGESSSVGDVRQACLATVPEVLETMFFEVLVDVPDVGPLPEFTLLNMSRVDFEGSARGHISVAASAGQTVSLADAFLALEDQDDRVVSAGLVLGELANIVCGNVLGRYQPDGVFRLSTPITKRGLPASELDEPGLAWLRFPLSSGPLFVSLAMGAAE